MTHDKIKALDKLIEDVESDSDIGFRFWFEADDAIPDLETRMLCETAFHGSLDAAKALHEALLPGWEWEVASSDAAAVFHGNDLHGPCELAASTNPARAWLIAILKAYRSTLSS